MSEPAAGPAPNMPRATGSRRISWSAVPKTVRAAIERLLGSPVVDTVSQPGGFSEGLAARVRLANGSRAFVKAASSLNAPGVADFHRREIAITRALPRDIPVPRLLDAYDDGTWVALLFEEIPGALPAQPWRRDDLDRVLETVTRLAGALTPSPVDPALLGRPRLGGWSGLPGDARERIAVRFPWAAAHLDELAALEATAASALAGDTLQHGDLYPFNVLLTTDRVFVVDWPHAWVGAAHCDVVTLMSNAAVSGLDPQPIAETHPLTRDLAPERINAFLAVHAGFLVRVAVFVGPEADSSIVEMMTALARASLDWLRVRL
jgi:hypothetical protein